MQYAVVLRHLAFEDLGSFGPELERRGLAVRHLEAGVDPVDTPMVDDADLLIVLGGPIGAYQEADYPFLSAELALLRRRLAADRPTLGICLGAQLMARALGARVYPGPQKEIGWSALSLPPEAEDGPLAHLAGTAVLHWHGDTFDLPEGAVRLASTARYPNQAFSCGRNGLALQFHPEVTVAGMERWFIGHSGEIHATEGLTVRQLRADTAKHGPLLERQGPRLLCSWLERVLG